MTTTLRGGFTTSDPRLDRLEEFDEKSRQFPLGTTLVAERKLVQLNLVSRTWGVGYWLDQGKEGRCVEFCICHDLMAVPVRISSHVVNDILAGRKIYWPAQREDPWPGGSYEGADPRYEGTSLLSGVKVAQRYGLYGQYRWAFSLHEALLGLGHIGPLMLGLHWYESMHKTKNGWLEVTGNLSGGHAILSNEVNLVWQRGRPRKATNDAEIYANLDVDASFIGLWNSWGRPWGQRGTAKLSVRNFDRLRREDGECCIAVDRLLVTKRVA